MLDSYENTYRKQKNLWYVLSLFVNVVLSFLLLNIENKEKMEHFIISCFFKSQFPTEFNKILRKHCIYA